MTDPGDGLATDDEIRDALDEARKNALANKAAAEILGKGKPAKRQGYPIPDPPPDQLILKMERALRPLQEKARAASTLDRDAFDREARQRFEDEGFLVDVKWWYSAQPGVYIPEVEPYALTEEYDDDPDRQVFDVTNDTLGLGDGGIIK